MRVLANHHDRDTEHEGTTGAVAAAESAIQTSEFKSLHSEEQFELTNGVLDRMAGPWGGIKRYSFPVLLSWPY